MSEVITNYYDKKILREGVEALSLFEKNEFIMYLANKHQKPVNEITEDFILDYHKKLKINDFSIRCEDDILEGFTSPTTGHTYHTGRDDQFNMFAKYIMTKDDPTVTEILWKAEDVGEQIPHTKEEFIEVVMEGFRHVERTLLKLDNLRKKIRKCTTDAELVAITWDGEGVNEE